MLSTYTKSGLTVEVTDWTPFTNDKGEKDSYLNANVIYEGNSRLDKIEGEMLSYVLKNADYLGLRAANGDIQLNIPSKYYAEAYYDIIL